MFDGQGAHKTFKSSKFYGTYANALFIAVVHAYDGGNTY